MTNQRKPTVAAPLRRIAAALLAVLLVTGCAAPPASAQLLGGGSEEALGAQEHPKILAQFGGAYPDQRLQAYIDRLGNRMAAQTGRQGPCVRRRCRRRGLMWSFTTM